MAVCKKIKRKKTKVCVGGMDSLITIWDRDLRAPDNSTTSATEKYSDPCPLWATLATVRPVELFDDSNTLIGTITHMFSIEYILRSLSVARTRIEFEGRYFRLLQSEDPEERHDSLLLKCELLGPTSSEANQ